MVRRALSESENMSALASSIVAISSLLIVSSLALEYISHPSYEVASECASWVLVLGGVKLYEQLNSSIARTFNSSDLSTIAFGITFTCLTSAVEKRVWYSVSLFATFEHSTRN